MTRIHTTGQDNWRYSHRTYQPTGLTREQIHGSLHTEGDVKGRYWLALLVGLCVVVAIGAAAV